MKTFILCIILVVAAVILILGLCLYMAYGKIKSLEVAKGMLLDERAKLSDQMRIKGIAVDRLTRELKKYSNVEIKVDLTGHEKQMILNALNTSEYKAWIESPKTKHVLRMIYRKLKEKIKGSIKNG